MIGRARWGGQSGYLFGLRFADREGILTAGYALFSTEPDTHLRQGLHNICVLGAKLLASVRKVHAKRQFDIPGQTFQSRMSDALILAADAYWEADERCLIHRVVQLNEGAGAGLAQKLEGRSLATVGKTIGQAAIGEFHNRRLELRGTEQILELSGRAMLGGGCHGIARLVASGSGAPPTIHHARSLIEKLEAARDHEVLLRKETELILDGLRILTSGASSRELFQQLLELLMPALEFHDAVILQRDWLSRIGVAAATSAHLADLDWQSACADLFAIDEIASVLKIPEDVEFPKSNAGEAAYGSALAVKLKGGSKPTLLLCLHRARAFFTTRHLGLSARLSLIAGQALMNEEERQKVMDASKLATIGEMAAGIIHEINQPLTVMTLGLNNLGDMVQSDKGLNPEKLVTKIVKLKGQITRVSKIVANMRVLARHSDGSYAPFRVEEAIREAAGIIDHKFAAAEIEIAIDVGENLEALGNALEFGQVVLNLLSNAHDALLTKKVGSGSANEHPRQVTVSAQAADCDWIELRVRDTGGGFPQHDAERAFQPFFTTKEPGKGTGLGLALCRRIIESMGGTISLGNWSAGAEICLRLKASPGGTS